MLLGFVLKMFGDTEMLTREDVDEYRGGLPEARALLLHAARDFRSGEVLLDIARLIEQHVAKQMHTAMVRVALDSTISEELWSFWRKSLFGPVAKAMGWQQSMMPTYRDCWHTCRTPPRSLLLDPGPLSRVQNK